MGKEILDFISKFKSLHETEIVDIFTNGCCYWFSYILKEQFNGTIYYDPINNHFACAINTSIYDITGLIGNIYDGIFVRWESYKSIEPFEGARIEFYCKDLK